MATVITHGVLPLLAGRRLVPKELPPRRLALAALLCSCLPDVDLLAFAYDVRPPDALAHRGLTHSLAFAAALALVLTAAFFPRRVLQPGQLKRLWAVIFAAGASHGLIDAFTQGDVGVALLWPLTSHRFLLPLHPVPVAPLGADEVLGRWGALVVFNELLLLWVPVLLIAGAVAARRAGRSLERLGDLTAVWLIVLVALKGTFPAELAPWPQRVLRSFGPRASDEDPGWIPRAGLPGGRLVTRFDELKLLGLLNQTLTPSATPWSSSFFPSGLGGAAGRWQDGRWTLLGRTWRGFEEMSEADARSLTESAQTDAAGRERLFRLAPTEKYDLAVGDFGLASTRDALNATHNARPRPRYWFGICNGIATAALERPEPFRVVDVVNPAGQTVRFHPNDVKALLGSAYYWLDDGATLGGSCTQVSLDPTGACAMNPGGLVLALLNRLGLAHDSFLIDVHPSPQSQHYAVASAKVSLVRGPYPYDDRLVSQHLADRVEALADVDVHLEVSATTLPLAAGDVPTADPTRYARTGLRPVPFDWPATLALDDAGTIIGGAWKNDGPDEVTFILGGPATDGGMLEINRHLSWPLVDAIAKASVDDGPGVPVIHAAEVLRGEVPDAGGADAGAPPDAGAP